jgi:hypothetical protein
MALDVSILKVMRRGREVEGNAVTFRVISSCVRVIVNADFGKLK